MWSLRNNAGSLIRNSQSRICRYHAKRPSEKFSGQKLIFTALSAGAFSYSIYLGYDQYTDNLQKSQTETSIDENVAAVPFPATDDELSQLINRKVILRGRFDHSREIFLDRRSNQNVKKEERTAMFSTDGYHLLTPFVLSDSGRRVLVNRGWISKRRRNPAKRILGQVEDEIEFGAFVLSGESLTMNNTLKSLAFFTLLQSSTERDVANDFDWTELQRKMQIDPIAYFVADKESTILNGPVGGQISTETPNFLNHLKPICWAIASIVIFSFR